ncbi:hypothetical protein [Autumnicola musiva]|jgi:transcriptional regulator with XRE-family HTH domain|uniref:XRE family transcriptional regulator n=1 Tax=Autumnicola musiva TaxID=3075589 RepID=A0ABU3DB38_9FLAO|nr:hypothetical protein [Zunongwangia sp. F117]MDT0678752.1 hypothetical protein [Zunongwangia sp. F117]
MDKFLQDIFVKAKEESGEDSLRKWAEYIAEYLLEEVKYPLSVKTLERYYNGETEPNLEKRNKLAVFLGYSDYREYKAGMQETQPKEEDSEKTGEGKSNKKYRKRIMLLVSLIGILVLGAGYLGYSSGSEDCMIWKEDHYEVTPCEGKAGETKKTLHLLENFRQIEVSDTTTFFRNGKANVWYDKHENELYFFSAPGINPETGKTVKEITDYMINKYVLVD